LDALSPTEKAAGKPVAAPLSQAPKKAENRAGRIYAV